MPEIPEGTRCKRCGRLWQDGLWPFCDGNQSDHDSLANYARATDSVTYSDILNRLKEFEHHDKV